MEAVKHTEVKPAQILADVQGLALATPVRVTIPDIHRMEVAAKVQEDGVGSLTTPPLPLAAPVGNLQAGEGKPGEIQAHVQGQALTAPVPMTMPEINQVAPHAQGGGLTNAVAGGAAKGACIACFEWLLEELTSCCCDD